MRKRGEQLILEIKNVDTPTLLSSTVPIKIIHVLADSRAYKQSDLLNKLSAIWENEKEAISVCYVVPEKRQQISNQIIRFFKSNEEWL